jgi:hypothetical protein
MCKCVKVGIHEFIFTRFAIGIHKLSRGRIRSGNQCHVYVRLDGLAAVAITDKEYPDRVAHTLLQKMLNEFETAHRMCLLHHAVASFIFCH